MLPEIYIEALLVDEGLADQVWEAWNAGEIDNLTACMAWSAASQSSDSDFLLSKCAIHALQDKTG